jgi:hypothetical protein
MLTDSNLRAEISMGHSVASSAPATAAGPFSMQSTIAGDDNADFLFLSINFTGSGITLIIGAPQSKRTFVSDSAMRARSRLNRQGPRPSGLEGQLSPAGDDFVGPSLDALEGPR